MTTCVFLGKVEYKQVIGCSCLEKHVMQLDKRFGCTVVGEPSMMITVEQIIRDEMFNELIIYFSFNQLSYFNKVTDRSVILNDIFL